MSSKIVLKSNSELIGVSDIVISEIGNQIFINNKSKIDDSVKGSLACYSEDGSSLIGTGNTCKWNFENSCLEISNIVSDIIVSQTIRSDNLYNENTITTNRIEGSYLKINDFISSKKVSIDKWLGFKSTVTEDQPFKISVAINPITNNETLIVSTNDYQDRDKSFILLGLEHDRMYVNGILNLVNHKTVTDPIGSCKDKKGDIVLDKDYLYICIADYTGDTKIWKRLNINEW